VVAFDAPGHGDSPDHRLYLTDLADTIADVAGTVGPLHGVIAHSFGGAAVLLAGARNGVTAPRNVMLAPNVLVDDAIARFADTVGLDARDRLALEVRLAMQTGLRVEELAVERLAAAREDALLVIHDRGDREVGFAHGERLAATWPGAQLHATEGLGHRRILRAPAILDAVAAFVARDMPVPASELVREVDRQLGLAS
jgi:pimeloyl-ACP methyl ester carboxylesterase